MSGLRETAEPDTPRDSPPRYQSAAALPQLESPPRVWLADEKTRQLQRLDRFREGVREELETEVTEAAQRLPPTKLDSVATPRLPTA